jgi:hypothetical protein
MARKKEKLNIAVIDFETDPFLFEREPRPFAAGFYDERDGYKEFWGDDCVTSLIIYLESRRDPLIIYAHNGGKFDFFFLLEEGALNNPAMMINGRIVKCGLIGLHEVRDSYAMMPIPLSAYDKDTIDYSKMERPVREQHRPEISKYLKKDCTSLFNLVSAFVAKFGSKLTVGAAAISEVQKFHTVPRRDQKHDIAFRPFYFGGRVECFESGHIVPSALGRKLKIFDVNSMYSKAMHAYDHPSSGIYITIDSARASQIFNHETGKLKGFGDCFYFMEFDGLNRGALPMRTEDGGITFSTPMGHFYACSHEIKASCELGLITILNIHSIKVCSGSMRFTEYVDHWMKEKVFWKNKQKECEKLNDDAGFNNAKAEETFAKFMLNSAYGKMATDPTKFKDYFILDNTEDGALEDFQDWKNEARERADNYAAQFDTDKKQRTAYLKLAPTLLEDAGRFEIWVCGNPDDKGYFDVAIGASITSAARSILLRAIHSCTRPLYCDTDSLICEALDGVEIHDSALGAWKFEGETDTLYIAGKKMYAAKDAVKGKDGKTKHKIASKGAKLEFDDIAWIATNPGKFFKWKSDAPNYGIGRAPKFITRNIRATVDAKI